jgi:hypothetical protein
MEDMKHKDDINHGVPQRRTGLRRRLRAAGLAAALAGTALLAAACGESTAGTDTFAPGATYAQTLAFAKCMRANGVPNFPNPDRQGNFNPANPQVQAMDRNALMECRSVLPNAGTGLTIQQIQQISQQNLSNGVKAARCMRAHGIANFPDPVASSQGEDGGVSWQPLISAIQAGLVSTSTPSYEAAFTACNGKGAGGGIPPDFAPGQTPDIAPSGPSSESPLPGFGNGS